jgi:hypothetical protein
MSSSKTRATLHATTSRARMLELEYLQSMHAEDLAFSTANKKKDAARKTELRRQQRLKELAASAERSIIKEKLRQERDLKRFIEQEEAQMHVSRRMMLREETQQKAVEEITYCKLLHYRFIKKGRSLEDIRGILLEFQGNQPSRTDEIHNNLVAYLQNDRLESLNFHVRWRKKSLETLYEILLNAAVRSNSATVKSNIHKQILQTLQIDERRRCELLLWPVRPDDEVKVPFLATCAFFNQPLRAGNYRLLHLLCKRRSFDPLSAEILLSCGASVEVDAKTDRGDTSLHVAARKGSNKMVAVLLRYGANVRARNNILSTPLLLAADRGHLSTVRMLFNLGGGVTMLSDANDRGITALHFAASMGHVLMTEQIIQWVQRGSQFLVLDRSNEAFEQKKFGKSQEKKRRNTGSYRAVIASEGERNSASSQYFTRPAEQTRFGLSYGGWRKKQHSVHGKVLAATTKRNITPLMCAAFHNNIEIISMLSTCMNVNEISMVDVDGLAASDYARRNANQLDKGSIMLVDPLLG